MITETLQETFAPPRESQTGNGRRNGGALGVDTSSLTRFLGWFSIGLGVTEVVAPGLIARLSGTKHRSGLVRFYGLREIAAGAGILAGSNPAPWLWFRVGGDVIDLASLIGGSKKGQGGATVAAVAAVAGVTAADIICAQRCSAQTDPAATTERAEASVLINRTPEECYRMWRDVENFPRFATEIRSVRVTGDRTSHWIMHLPAQSGPVEWDAEIMEDVPNQRISWRCLRGSVVDMNGSVSFDTAPGNRGAMVRVQLDYEHPGVSVLAPLSKLAGKHPEQMIYKTLRRLKQLMETGEVITTEGQPAGRRSSTTWLDSIAR